MLTSEQIEAVLPELPGGEIVERGLRDLRCGVLSEEALVCLVARPRLRALGLDVPYIDLSPEPAEHLLYAALELRLGRGGYSAYNALIRRIVSFARAADMLERRNSL